MSEFENRIDAQRAILKIVNDVPGQQEALFGLSRKAIDRWITSNSIDPTGRLAELVVSAGKELFFLANKSQEQVTDEYRLRSSRVSEITALLGDEVKRSFAEPR